MNGSKAQVIAICLRVAFFVSPMILLGRAHQAHAQCGGTWTQHMPAAFPSARFSPALAYDAARGQTVLFGGSPSAISFLGDTWTWDGTTWTQRGPAVGPPVRRGHALAYDAARGVTVMFGGVNGSTLGDTWEWDGTTWTQRSPAASPPARGNHAMAYDTVRSVTVLFGGSQNGSTNLGDTWEWDGTNWTQRSPAVGPPTRQSHAMAYDAARGVTVLFGGLNGGALGDTWEWDGTNWTQHSPGLGPPARQNHAMAFDATRGVTVLFGGTPDGTTNLGDTWEWDATNWTQRSPAVGPPARQLHAMAYDTARGVTVLFGGYNGGNLGDTWEWIGPGPFVSQQPTDKSVADGQTAVFSVTAGGTGPFTYHWRRNSAPLSDGGAISGSLTATLTVNPAGAANNGPYDCVVSNACGSVASRAATLATDACRAVGTTGDCNANGILDSCEIAADATLDANNNAILDSCESSAPPAATACGQCGAGAATMLPMALIGLMATARRLLRVRLCK